MKLTLSELRQIIQEEINDKIFIYSRPHKVDNWQYTWKTYVRSHSGSAPSHTPVQKLDNKEIGTIDSETQEDANRIHKLIKQQIQSTINSLKSSPTPEKQSSEREHKPKDSGSLTQKSPDDSQDSNPSLLKRISNFFKN